MNENRDHLRRQFLERLLQLRPESVLDVGCGEGQILQSCRQLGIPAAGVEPDATQVAHLMRFGLAAQAARAEALPFADNSYDWVTLRHVLHHLEDPGAALREASRIAQTGILLAEPWFDTAIGCQEVALSVDRWLKAQHRRLGQVHRENLSADDVLQYLPDARRGGVDCQYCLRWRPRPMADFSAEATELLAGLPEMSEARAEYRELLRQIDARGLSWNGSLIMRIRKAPLSPEHPGA